MAPLPKHLRPRYRYLAVGLASWPDAAIDRSAFQEAAWEAARALLGDVGSASMDLRLFHFDFEDGAGEAVVRVRRDAVESARAALACVDAVDGHPVGLHVRGASGTVRACEEKYLGERPEAETRTVDYEGAARTAFVRGDRVDVRLDDVFTGITDLDY